MNFRCNFFITSHNFDSSLQFCCIGSVLFGHLIASVPQTFNRNNRIHVMTSTVLFHDESESPGSRMHVYVLRACACRRHAKFASRSSNSSTLRLAIQPDANDRSYTPMECIRLLKSIAASLDCNSTGCSKLTFLFFSEQN